MMGERGGGDAQLVLDIADHQSLRVGGQKKLHDAQPGLRAHGGEHVGVAGDLFRVLASSHSSIILEIRNTSSRFPLHYRAYI